MIHLRRLAIPLLASCSLSVCSAPNAQVLGRGTPNHAVLAAAHSASASSPAPAPTKADIERWRKVLSNWGRWGAEDQLGAVNLITPTKRIEAARLVKEGIAIRSEERRVGKECRS